MTKKRTEKKKYIPPRITTYVVDLENSIAASSVTIRPGGGPDNDNPWVIEETKETKHKEWDFFD